MPYSKKIPLPRSLLLSGLLLLVVLVCVVAATQHFTTKIGVMLFLGGSLTLWLGQQLLGIAYRKRGRPRGLWQLRSMKYLALRFYAGQPSDYRWVYRNNLKDLELITQAAILHPDTNIYTVDAPGRHHHVIAVLAEMSRAGLGPTEHQGFMTSHGRFVDRIQGLAIAKAAQQIIHKHDSVHELYSEDLWESPKPGLHLVNVHRENDEPFFLLLARDPQAPELIQQWARDRQRIEPSSSKIADALSVALMMVEWKSRHSHIGLTREAYGRAMLETTLEPQEQLRFELEALVMRARTLGLVVTIETRPTGDTLRMGGYETVIELRDDMPTWRAKLAAAAP